MDNKQPDVPRHYATLHIGLNIPGSSGVADKGRVIAFLKDRFESYSVTEALGVFRGEREPALIIGIAVSDPQEAAEIAAALREHFQWEGVGIVFQGVYHRATADATPRLLAIREVGMGHSPRQKSSTAEAAALEKVKISASSDVGEC